MVDHAKPKAIPFSGSSFYSNLKGSTRGSSYSTFRPSYGLGVRQMKLGNALEKLLDGHGQLHARQIRSDASMNAETEGGVVISVVDDGCGMSAEFMRNSLFRPFQTTKKTGLGIGMFQSRMIVEAHGGEITATSVLAKGTTFRVFLPHRI